MGWTNHDAPRYLPPAVVASAAPRPSPPRLFRGPQLSEDLLDHTAPPSELHQPRHTQKSLGRNAHTLPRHISMFLAHQRGKVRRSCLRILPLLFPFVDIRTQIKTITITKRMATLFRIYFLPSRVGKWMQGSHLHFDMIGIRQKGCIGDFTHDFISQRRPCNFMGDRFSPPFPFPCTHMPSRVPSSHPFRRTPGLATGCKTSIPSQRYRPSPSKCHAEPISIALIAADSYQKHPLLRDRAWRMQ